jgi:hypothetical protein
VTKEVRRGVTRKLKGKTDAARAERGELEPDMVKWLVRGVMTARPDELDCHQCFEQLDRFVEIKLVGKDPAEAMPLVQDHLERCRVCREEFEALLAVLHSLAG